MGGISAVIAEELRGKRAGRYFRITTEEELAGRYDILISHQSNLPVGPLWLAYV